MTKPVTSAAERAAWGRRARGRSGGRATPDTAWPILVGVVTPGEGQRTGDGVRLIIETREQRFPWGASASWALAPAVKTYGEQYRTEG